MARECRAGARVPLPGKGGRYPHPRPGFPGGVRGGGSLIGWVGYPSLLMRGVPPSSDRSGTNETRPYRRKFHANYHVCPCSKGGVGTPPGMGGVGRGTPPPDSETGWWGVAPSAGGWGTPPRPIAPELMKPGRTV